MVRAVTARSPSAPPHAGTRATSPQRNANRTLVVRCTTRASTTASESGVPVGRQTADLREIQSERIDLRPRLGRHDVAKASERRIDAAEQALAIIGHSRDARAIESEESPHVADRRRRGAGCVRCNRRMSAPSSANDRPVARSNSPTSIWIAVERALSIRVNSRDTDHAVSRDVDFDGSSNRVAGESIRLSRQASGNSMRGVGVERIREQ